MPKKPDENNPEIQMPDIGDPDPIEKKVDKSPTVEEQLTALTEAVTSMSKMATEGAERETRMQSLMTQTLSNPAPVAAVQTPAPEPIKMPDPVEDADGFAAALLKKIEDSVGSAMAANTAVTSAVTAEQSQNDDLWTQYSKTYEDNAKFPRLVTSAASTVNASYTARGLDAFKTKQADPLSYLREVDAIVSSELSAIRGEEKKPEEPNRTELAPGDGTMGGSGSEDPADKEAGNFVEELKSAQKASGVF